MCYFFINILILKTGMSAIGSVSSFIRLQHLLYFWLKLHYIMQQFLLVGVQGLVLSQAQCTLAKLLILTLLIFERCALCNYIELSKPSFTSSLSRKD